MVDIAIKTDAEPRKKLVWFQHMHKAAGSSIIAMAYYSGATFHNRHANGNPVFTDEEFIENIRNSLPIRRNGSREIPYYDYSQKELDFFIDQEIENEVDFIACEWRYPLDLCHRPDVLYFTCFRDPWERWISNFNFDKRGFPQKYDTLEKWSADTTDKPFVKDNYYTRILSGLPEKYEGEVTSQHLEKAMENLLKFDCVIVIENTQSLMQLELVTGWVNDGKTHNKAITKKQYPNSEIKARFLAENRFDYILYELAKKISETDEVKLSPGEKAFQQQLSGDQQHHMWNNAMNLYKSMMASEGDNRELAVGLLYSVLKRTTRGLLDRVDPDLTEVVQPYNRLYTSMNRNLMSNSILLEIIFTISFEAYYTSQPELGVACCRALLNTELKHGYTKKVVEKNLSYYM